MLDNAFNLLIRMKQISGTLKRDATTINVKVTPSSYSRTLSGPSNIEIEGEEFILSKNDLESPITEVKRGDRLTLDNGTFLSVKHVIPLYNIGGGIMGWRLRSG